MNALRAFLIFLFALALTASVHAEGNPASNKEDTKLTLLVSEGDKLAEAHQFKEAMERFDATIAAYEDKFHDSQTRSLLCAVKNINLV